MNTPELQRLKMAWLAAKEAGDTQAQLRLLRDHPGEQAALIDFIAAYHASGGARAIMEEHETPLLPVTQRAMQTAIQRVFTTLAQAVPVQQVRVANLQELRKLRNLGKVEVARGLRLSVDVWNKFEAGAIELSSLTRHQLERLASFFQVSGEQFGTLLGGSQPSVGLNRRQAREAAHVEQQGPQQQTFAAAIDRSTMTQEDKAFWLGLQ